MKRMITNEMMDGFRKHLIEDEKSQATIEKYMRDIHNFASFAAGRPVDKMLLLDYKQQLGKTYALTSANSMLAAVNAYFDYAGWQECCVKQFRIQRQAFCPVEKELTKEEYFRLVKTAQQNGNERLSLIIETLAGTGIRISELENISVEAIMQGEAIVNCKGKSRRILLVKKLRRKLKSYISRKKIESGPVFVSRSGRPLSRSNIWREMKRLCGKAGVSESKVFPHNFRHLFARTFYAIDKDIAKLADLLGHASINTTRIYIITTGAEHRRRMEKMQLII